MTNWLTFTIGALATYYLARCVSTPTIEGPWRLFERMRGLFTADDWKGRGIRCHVCVSLYAALVITIGLCLLGDADGWHAPLVWFGLAGASVLIDKYWSR